MIKRSSTLGSADTLTQVGRDDPDAQKEHMRIAEDCKTVFIKYFPSVSEALNWK